VDRVDADPGTKARAKAILATMSGELTVVEACEALGISKSRFEMLRAQMLEAAVRGLEPGKPGRPRRREGASDARVKRLESEVEELRQEMEIKDLALELGGLLPEVEEAMDVPEASKKKSAGSKRPSRQERRRLGRKR
jgi:hypothetical protein